MFGVRFSFIATRTGLTRVRHYDTDNEQIKKEALAFARKHARAIDETFYSRTVDYNMLINENATLIQVPFNNYEKIRESLMSAAVGSNTLDSADQLGLDPTFDSTDNPSPTFTKSIKEMNLIEQLELLTNQSIHVIATQSIIVNEGEQRAVTAVTGVFYNYASFVLRFFNSTNSRFDDNQPVTRPAECFTESFMADEACDDPQKSIRCGFSNDTIDCLLVDNNGYIVVSEDLEFIGRHLKGYEPSIMERLVSAGVFHEINITDYQSVCMRQEEKQSTSNAFSSSLSTISFLFRPERLFVPAIGSIIDNFVSTIIYSWTVFTTLIGIIGELTLAQPATSGTPGKPQLTQQQALQPMLSLLPNKTYLRPCEKTLTLYESGTNQRASVGPERFKTRCNCDSWFVYRQVPKTNLFLIIVDTTPTCRHGCDVFDKQQIDPTDPWNAKYSNTDDQVCSMLERESKMYRKKLDSCFEHHPDEEHIKLCGAAGKSAPISVLIMLIMTLASIKFVSLQARDSCISAE